MSFNSILAKAAATVPPKPAPRIRKVDEAEAKRIMSITLREGEVERISVTNQRVENSIDKKIKISDIEQESINVLSGLSQLVDDDFPFDESQLAAIDGLIESQNGCLTGAAGTGKTTVTKKFTQRIKDELKVVDMTAYWKNKKGEDVSDKTDGEGEEYDSGGKARIPSICLVGYTGRSTQMIKKNFPVDWHPNIMTIHRMLGFYPEFETEEEWDDAKGEMVDKKKMRFVPLYDKHNKLPWDVILIDEAGMVSVDLWEQLRSALKPTTRVYMIGDINQLPPVHGRSIFGFAMSKWPTFELTHIHRQEGVNNSIVDNAWQIIHGKALVQDNPKGMGFDKGNEGIVEALNWMLESDDWKFAAMKLPGMPTPASRTTRLVLKALTDHGWYDPIRDTTVTPINGHDGSRGMNLGQIPMNRELALQFNGDAQRYIIDGGVEHKYFAVGDKVMATKNDYETGITNGMTGTIVSIESHEGYAGEKRRFGKTQDVQEWLEDVGDSGTEFVPVDMSAIRGTLLAQREAKEKQGESRDRGPASHIVTVAFGAGKNLVEIPFGTLSEVGSLQTAYVVTCHKMQGGESPKIVIICHDAHAAMFYREWLYTAVTRASQQCLLLYTDRALNSCLRKQKVKGKTLAEKVESFDKLAEAAAKAQSANQVSLTWGHGA